MNTLFEPNVKTAVQFGAGNVGRGFMGQLFRESGFHTVFVNVDASLVARLNEQGRYPLRLLDAYTRTVREIVIDDFSALRTSEPDKIQQAIADAQIVATAVGVKNLEAIAPLLSAGIEETLRKVTGIDPKTPLGRKIIEHYYSIAGR